MLIVIITNCPCYDFVQEYSAFNKCISLKASSSSSKDKFLYLNPKLCFAVYVSSKIKNKIQNSRGKLVCPAHFNCFETTPSCLACDRRCDL